MDIDKIYLTSQLRYFLRWFCGTSLILTAFFDNTVAPTPTSPPPCRQLSDHSTSYFSSRLSGRARLRRALTGQIELASAKFHDTAVQLNRFVSKGTFDCANLGFSCRRILDLFSIIFDYYLLTMI